MTWLVPATFVPEGGWYIAWGLGFAAIVLGAGLNIAADRELKRAGTPTKPTMPSTALVTGGIYRWTRNPMYLGMSLILAGIGIATGSLWFILMVPVAAYAVTKLAIGPEERYLAEFFGAAYLDYRNRVRRWF